ncbi:MAG: efflux RND transporter periplasmic adaptor subunit [Bryobacteraceae bacterium]
MAEGATPKLVFEKSERDHAALELESKNLDEVARQAESRAVTLQKDLDLARKHLEAKGEELERTKAQVAAGDIYSPVTGTVAARQADVGAEVDPSLKNLFQIAVDLSTMEAVLEPSPAQLAKIKVGQMVYISVAEAVEPIPGAVQRIEAGKAIIEFANPGTSLKPGLTAKVRIKLT